MAEASVGRGDVLRCLSSCGLAHAELAAGAGSIVVSAYGGRIFGPFVGAESLGWLSPLFGDPEGFRAAVAAGAWNLGGERLWLAPELRYCVRDRKRFLESYTVQPAMDPGG
ncbi:MAG: hypothetical protein JW820_09820, partial [Spirochaetales bacterium]|nr:hypothetical protein [Spirochaetales bacterium]